MEDKIIDVIIKEYDKRRQFGEAQTRDISPVLFLKMMNDHFKQARFAADEGKKLVWIGLFAPIELFYAFDLVPFSPEYFGMTLVSLLDCSEYVDLATGYGIPSEICSLHRLVTGLAINDELPRPDLVVSTCQTCDTTIKSYELISNFYQTPRFFVDFPYKDTPEALKYYETELKGLVTFLEEQTGRTLDMDKLKEILALSAQLEELFLKIDDLKKEVPAPMGLRAAIRHFGIRLVLTGTRQGVTYFKTVLDECRELAAAKKGVVPEERLRLLWFYVPVLFGRLYEWMQRKHGAVVVMDNMNIVSREKIDPAKPFEALTQKAFRQFITAQYCQPIETFVKDALDMVRDYKIDGCIYQAHIGCKHGCAIIRVLQDAIQKECGVPFYVLDGDGIDPSVVSIWEMTNKIEGFLEMLED